tara:strand:+ start:67895 stop:69055 length:1161 start_codon:yes stop_codon:yes gene_type:complete
MKTLSDLTLKNQRLIIREDLNVPLDDNGDITSDLRIQAALPTIQYALEQGAAVILLSHLGRPSEGEYDKKYSLAPVAKRLQELLGHDVTFVKDYLNGIDAQPGDVILCENVRFNKGEEKDDDALAKQYAALGDIFVMDAFATSHRAQASTHGVAKFAKQKCAGPLLQKELNALGSALENPAHPLLAIVGGSKVSTKLTVLEHLAEKVDQLIVGGGIANTFIAACGYNVGKSLYEPDLIEQAKTLMQQAKARGADIPVPTDVVVGKAFSADTEAVVKPVDQVADDDMIFDIGPDTAKRYADMLAQAKTIVWNGPVGVFEFPQFGEGTHSLAKAIAESPAFSIAGGGDTIAAIEQYNVNDQISYISTAGGAFLEFLEGKTLPGVAVLK